MKDSKIREELQALGKKLLEKVKPFVPSETIADSLQSRVTKQPDGHTILLFSPYYWAGILHEGRGPIIAQPGRYLVYFREPSDDPRLQPWKTYPKKKTDIRRLTTEEFYYGLSINKEMYRANKNGGPMQFMVVTPDVGPAIGVPFFFLGLKDLQEDLREVFQKTLTRDFEANIKKGNLNLKFFV